MQRSSLKVALRFLVCETKESVVTFASRWYATKPLASGSVWAAAKSYLRLLIADQGLITLINGQGIEGPDLWGLLSVSVQLKRSRRMSEEAVGPVGAIPGLAADTSQMDPVALVQNMFAEGYRLLHLHRNSALASRAGVMEREKMAFCALPSECLTFFSPPCTQALFLNYTVVIHNDKVDLAPFLTDRGGVLFSEL